MNTLYTKDIISFTDLNTEEVQLILQTAKKIKERCVTCSIQDKLIANCFFEPSTRTRLSFEAAIFRMGGKVIGFPDDSSLSVRKGETLSDTMRVIAGYADLIVIRHPRDGSARLTAEVADCPVINAGDGANQHPTQALIELFSIQECQSSINGLSIALVGDLKYGRAIHSFIEACLMFDVRLYLVSPELLILPDSICDKLKKRGVRFSFHQQIEEVIPKVDILYITRIQQERFTETEYQLIQSKFILTANMLEKAKKNLKVLHPLPRVNEVALDVDHTPYAYYFQQASNGVVIRQALLALILNEELP
ncbi:MAG: aspartate carbamoyltransferase [Gammaproteobacteria bacterium RIFCSPHIGHO2_12_FULL_37_34]|nr:MAG: aspartate carbamoyltransferase [Gammaproteobacteria bacterium RIFCSPHIGHO2_12_FULL_37_34]